MAHPSGESSAHRQSCRPLHHDLEVMDGDFMLPKSSSLK